MQITKNKNEFAFYIMIIGMFMAILDIQIVASSIGEIQAHLSASLDEVSWVQTAYLIAEVVSIPMSGWLAKALSTRFLFTISASMFTLMSVGCASAWDLESMIFFRVFQGFFGASMIPLVFSCAFIIFPPEKHIRTNIIVGLCATLGTTIGPTIGGWITENFSWHWLFLLNVIPGIIVAYLVYNNLDIDKPQFELFKIFDYPGFIFTALSLGCLEYFLKEGNKQNWFESAEVIIIFLIMTSSFIILLIRELTHPHPLINLYAFKDRNFTIGCLISFGVGIGLYGAVYLIPVSLSTIKGYNALEIGKIMFITGVFQLFSGPITATILKYLGPRTVLGIGLIGFAVSMIIPSFLNDNFGFNELFWPQAIRGFSIMFCFMPMTAITLGNLPHEIIHSASGLYNLMRNLGGAVGIGIINLILTRKSFEHYTNLSTHLEPDNYGFLEFKNAMQGLFSPYITDPFMITQLENNILHNKILKQATMIAFNDAFAFIGTYLIMCLLILPFANSVKNKSDDIGGGH